MSKLRNLEGLQEFYEGQYATSGVEGERFGAWRALGATRKAANVISLAAYLDSPPLKVAEIGCGDGALLAELAARGFGETLDGFDISESAVGLARERTGIAAAEVFDGQRTHASDDAYDLAILSHVLEHVPDPAELLREAGRIAGTVILEVPLEDNRSARRSSREEMRSSIGHIQQFSQASMARLLNDADLQLCRDLTDPLTLEFHLFFADTRKARLIGHAKAAARATLYRVSPTIASGAFTLHYAALCKRPQSM